MRTVSVIGLGIMGYLAADLLCRNGYLVRGVDPVVTARQRAAEAGIAVCDSPDAAMRGADAAILFVPGPAHTRSVVAGPDGLLQGASPGSLIVNASTVDPVTNQEMAALAQKQGVGYLDAPLLGRPSGVGQWSFLVGGEKRWLDTARDMLALLAGSPDKLFHMGPLGHGNRAKLLNNLMFGAINACTAEVMALAKWMGLPGETLFHAAVAAGAGTVSNLYRELVPRILEDRYGDPSFTVDMLRKDNQLALDMAAEAGAHPLLARTVALLNEKASAVGLGGEDTAAMWKMIAAEWQRQGGDTEQEDL